MLNAAFLLSTFLVAAPPTPTADVLSGSWWVIGNGTAGELSMQIAADGTVTGTIYGQAITGKFETKSKQVTFKRFPTAKVGKDSEAVQEWNGALTVAHSGNVANFHWNGKFKATHSKDWGELGVEYVWTGQATRRPTPANELQEIQGAWVVGSATDSNNKKFRLPDEARLNDRGNKIAIEKNQVMCDGKIIATLTNDVASKALNEELGFHGFRLLMLTTPDGRGLLCSYAIDQTGIEIAYPHTTSCHRGSGQIIRLTRPAQPSP